MHSEAWSNKIVWFGVVLLPYDLQSSSKLLGSIRPSVQKLKLNQKQIFLHNKDLKHTSKSKKCVKKKKWRVVEWPSQSLDLSPLEI